MSEALATTPLSPTDETIANVLIKGDLSGLTDAQRLRHYMNVCETLGLNPLSQPFDYLRLSRNGVMKTVLYANRDATEQLRKIHGVSIVEVHTQEFKDVYTVIAKAVDKTGRTDVSTGVVSLGNLKGDNLANALMKAETKAKRRVTLSICGLGMLDESELETVKDAVPANYIVEAPKELEAPGAHPEDAPEKPSVPNGGESSGIHPPPPAIDPLPLLDGRDLSFAPQPLKIVRVLAGEGGSRAIVVFSSGAELPVYKPQLASLAEQIAQEGVPVVIETKVSAAGRIRLEKLNRAPTAEAF